MSGWAGSGGVWYLMRASGVVSLLLLTAVFVLGIATTSRWRTRRLPGFAALGLHRNISLLAVSFLAVHVVTAVVDPYAAVGVAAVVVPFLAGRGAFWAGLGALSLDLTAALVVTSLLRRHLGLRAWRAVHRLAYLSWPLALAHSLGAGSDSAALWLRLLAAGCIAAAVTAIAFRLRGAESAVKHRVPHLEPRPA